MYTKGYDTHTTVKNILEIMSETEESLKIGNILCIFTYVTDVCVMIRDERVQHYLYLYLLTI